MTVVRLLLDFIYRRPEFSLDGVSTKDVRDLRDLATTYDMKDLVYATNQKECPTRFDTLTDEVVLMILQYLPVPDLVNLRGVSTKLAGLAVDKKFWKRTFIVDMHLFRANEDFITRDLVNLRGRSFPDSTYVGSLSDLDLYRGYKLLFSLYSTCLLLIHCYLHCYYIYCYLHILLSTLLLILLLLVTACTALLLLTALTA